MLKKIVFLVGIVLIGYIAFFLIYQDVGKLKKEHPQKTSFMKYREREGLKMGKPIFIKQQWVPLKRISPYLVKAVIIAEDDKFWTHEGFDFEAIQEAIEKDLKARKFKVGGSTISQQLAKNLYLTPEKNLLRKVKEAILTWRIERALSKKRIIELYLNVVEWGEGLFGAEAAARHYFAKSAAFLSPDEAARLAVVLPNPRKWNPAQPTPYVIRRARVIYNIMLKRGIVIPVYEEVMKLETGEESPQLPEPTPSPSEGKAETPKPDQGEQGTVPVEEKDSKF